MDDICFLDALQTASREPSVHATVDCLTGMAQRMRRRLRERISCRAQKDVLLTNERAPDALNDHR